MAAGTDIPSGTIFPGRQFHPLARATVALIVLAVAILALHHLAADIRWQDVKSDIARYSQQAVLSSVLFTMLSFAALSIYDVLAVETVARGKVRRIVAAATGACGYAISNLLGFSVLTGGAVRMRIYSSLGLDVAQIAGVIANSWFSFWLGILVLFGALFAFHPAGGFAAFGISKNQETALGVALLVMIGVLFVWLSRRGRIAGIGSYRVTLPTMTTALTQTMAAIVDVLGAALALYALMPADLVQNFPLFFVVYVVAIGLSILSHSPSGIGVFEATVIAGLGAGGRSDVIAALALYRLVYYLLPFLIAAVSLAIIWIYGRSRLANRLARTAYKTARPLIPPFAAGIALSSGIILVVSGNLPAEGSRLAVLREILPLPLVEASHLAGSIAGTLLVVIARGLYRKQYRAWLIAIILMSAGFVASLAKGLDWEEAVSMVVAVAVLSAFRSAFYRAPGQNAFRMTWQWTLGGFALIASASLVGLFAFSHVQYENELWWQFAWHGDASRFLRASLAVSVIFFAVGLDSLISRRSNLLRPEPIPDRVRELVFASPDTDAFIALTGDKRFLLSDDGLAFLSYADAGHSLITKGDPVGNAGAAERLIWQFREYADRLGKHCAFYAVGPDYVPAYLDMGLTILKIGEVGRVDLRTFGLDGASKKDFRQARNRAAREGYFFQIVRAGDLDECFPALRRISDAWLESKQGEEKGFALGAFDKTYLVNFDHAVLRHASSGSIVAFSNLLQGAGRQELTVDLMRYDPDGPKFAMDALFAEIMLWGKAEGFQWFSLGAAPLSGMHDHPLATTWNRIGHYIYHHGENIYRFEGLREFKEKFDPVWTPNYLAGPGGLDLPRILYDVNLLISGGLRGLIR